MRPPDILSVHMGAGVVFDVPPLDSMGQRTQIGGREIDARAWESMRGYFGIGIVGGKCPENIGTLWRSAYQLGAAFIFTAGARYPKHRTDTLETWRHVPLYHYDTPDALVIPDDCTPVVVETGGKPLASFHHPQRALYVLGSEDRGIPQTLMTREWRVITLPSVRTESFNVAVAGSIVMMHRLLQADIRK